MSTAKERLKAILAQNAGGAPTDKSPLRPSVPFVSTATPLVSVEQVLTPAGPIHPTAPDPDDFAERAAIIEHDGRISQPLADCLAAILTAGKPLDMPPVRWLRFQTDAALLIEDWGAKALALGWATDDLLGVDTVAPWERIDRMGLAWLLNGDTVTALDGQKATIRTATAVQTFTRKGI